MAPATLKAKAQRSLKQPEPAQPWPFQPQSAHSEQKDSKMKDHLLLPDQASGLCDRPATPVAMSDRQTGDGCAHRGRLACPGSKGYPDLPDQPPRPGLHPSLPQLASPWPEGSSWNRGVTPYSGPSHLPAPGLPARPPSGPFHGLPSGLSSHKPQPSSLPASIHLSGPSCYLPPAWPPMPLQGWAWGTAGLHTQAPALTDGIGPGVVHARPRVSTLSGPELTQLLYHLKTAFVQHPQAAKLWLTCPFPSLCSQHAVRPWLPGSSAGRCGPMTQHWPRRRGQKPGTDSLARPSQFRNTPPSAP